MAPEENVKNTRSFCRNLSTLDSTRLPSPSVPVSQLRATSIAPHGVREAMDGGGDVEDGGSVAPLVRRIRGRVLPSQGRLPLPQVLFPLLRL